MGQSNKSTEAGSRMGAAVGLTVALSLLVGGTIHYSLKEQGEARDIEYMQLAHDAGTREVVALSRTFASLGGGLVQTDLFRLQEMLTSDLIREGLVDAEVIDPDNMIMAAKNQALIGKQIQDTAWVSVRAQNKEIISRSQDAAGRILVTTVEPMKEKGETQAWARMTYAIAEPVHALPSRAERLKQTATLLSPLVVGIFFVILAAFHISASGVRKQIQAVMTPVYASGAIDHSAARLKKVS